MSESKLIAVVGPTASGKSELALELAEQIGGEIVSADSMQIYRGMDIGTAKPSRQEQERVPHHMISIVDPDCRYSAGQYQQEARQAISSVQSRGKIPVLVGGSGLYVNAITYGLDFAARPEADPALRRELEALSPEQLRAWLQKTDPAAAERIHPHNIVRLRRALEIALGGGRAGYDFDSPRCEYNLTVVGMNWPREELYARINDRVSSMMAQDLPGEVEALFKRYGGGANAMQAIGYKEIIAYLQGSVTSLDEAAEQIRRNTRHFAKRQLTWFRRDGRIHWLDPRFAPADHVMRLLEDQSNNGNATT